MNEELQKIIDELEHERTSVRQSPGYAHDEYDHGYVGALGYAIGKIEKVIDNAG